MACADKTNANSVSAKLARIIRIRSATCAKCKFNSDGVCIVTKEAHPDRPALIEVGIQNPLNRCPLPTPKWLEANASIGPTACVRCHRETSEVDESGVCIWCHSDDDCNQRNAAKGINTFPPGSRGHTEAVKKKAKIRESYANRMARKKDLEIKPRPFNSPVKHLHFFFYPRYGNSTWYHIDKIREFIWQFNGHRVCCVATNRDTIHDRIRSDLVLLFDEVYEVPNNPRRRELVGFIPTLKRLQIAGATGEDDAICFAHSKGQQEKTATDATVREWTNAMYETVVGNWSQAEAALAEGYPLAGSFKVIGNFRTTPYRWHYSGTFFWARAAAIFEAPNWTETCNRWWGSESYVGRHWASDEGYCLFADLGRKRAASVYDKGLWDNQLREELEQWRRTTGP